MKIPGLVQLAAQDLKAARARSLIAALGIGVGVGVLLVIAGLGLGARDVVLQEVVRTLPVDMIEVIPKTIDLGLFKTDSLFGGAALDAKTLARMRSIDGVAAAYPKLDVKLPMGARGGGRIFGRPLYTDLFMKGVPAQLLGAEVSDLAPPYLPAKDGVVPVVISDQLIEVFNTSVAPSLGIPQLSNATLEGFEFDIVLGRSLMLGHRGARAQGTERARIVGVSRYAMRLGVTVPLTTARRLLAKYGDPGAQEIYSSILLHARSPKDVPEITASVRAMGFAVDETAERTSDILAAATALASLVGLLVLALAGLNIAHSFFAALSERRRELAVLRAVGARRVDLVTIVEAQALMLGIGGGLLGILGAHLASMGIDLFAATLLPDFPFKPETFFSLPTWLDAAGFVAALLAAALGALWPAVRAAGAQVAEALAQG